MTDHRVIPPHLFVIIGGTGDLATRKLLPALGHLLGEEGAMERSRVVGVGSRLVTDDEYRARVRKALVEARLPEEQVGRWCDDHVHYQSIGDEAGGMAALAARIEGLERDHRLDGNRVFYLAMPPARFPDTIEALGRARLNRSPGWTRLVIEKPFGRDLESARHLNEVTHRHFDETQVFRIDHYLGKETVQNLLVFRFANSLFESAWNRDRIASVQITVAETLGVEGRAAFYESAGAMRDIVQNHLTQVLSLVAMEPPVKLEADAIHDEKVKVLRAVSPVYPDDVVYGQYAAGHIDGEPVPGYREEPGVDPESTTETAVAMRLRIDNWRWQGVPFLLRTGKRFPRRLTQIVVTFRQPPVCLFEVDGTCQVHANVLVITLQPDEGFSLYFDVKAPDERMRLETLPLRFRYAEEFREIPEAYETLIRDVLIGDHTLFVRNDEVELAWALYDPVIASGSEVRSYPAGSWGPQDADFLASRAGVLWAAR